MTAGGRAAAPPADPETGRVHTPWANDRSLVEAEKRDLLDWLAGGKPIGDPADALRPRPRGGPGGWQIGTPDAVFEFAERVPVKATGVMPYQTVFVETHLPEDRWGPQTSDEMHLGYVEYFLPGVALGRPLPGLRQ